jgi:hypothetical protein
MHSTPSNAAAAAAAPADWSDLAAWRARKTHLAHWCPRFTTLVAHVLQPVANIYAARRSSLLPGILQPQRPWLCPEDQLGRLKRFAQLL